MIHDLYSTKRRDQDQVSLLSGYLLKIFHVTEFSILSGSDNKIFSCVFLH